MKQAIGRVIRHKNDFGAVLLLDKRFGSEGNAKKLPVWLEKSVVESNFRKGMARLAQFFHHNRHNTKIKPQTNVPPTVIEKRPLVSHSNEKNVVMAPLNKKKKIVLKPRQPLFSGATKNEIVENQSIMKTSNNIAIEHPTTDIQQFVLLLKRKLEKSNLKKLIYEIKEYKEHGNIERLIKLLKECCLQDTISKEDIKQFRPFVRKDDETVFDDFLTQS
jgi:hypothetical protein